MQSAGATNDFGFHVGKDKVHVHNLRATILHRLGFDHMTLTCRFQGRDFRLTDVPGEVGNRLLGGGDFRSGRTGCRRAADALFRC